MTRTRWVLLGTMLFLGLGCAGEESSARGGGGSDHDTSTSADIGFGEAVQKDEAGVDVASPDGASLDTSPDGSPDASPDVSPDDTPAGDVPCPGGVCVDTTPDCSGLPTGCDQPGARRCSSDGKAVEECNGGYECPKWDVVQACATGETCLGSQCVSGSSCAQLESCVDTSCATEAASGSDIKLAKCTLSSCRTEYEACLGPFGTGACKDILKCAQACQSSSCQQDCLKQGSYDADLQFVDVGVCLEDNCPAALQDPMGNISCIIGSCSTQLNACCAGNMMSCF